MQEGNGTEAEARGFALYVGVDEDTAAAAGVTLSDLVVALRKTVAELVPAAGDQTYAAVALAPKGLGGKPVDVVRIALRDPRALDDLTLAKAGATSAGAAGGPGRAGETYDPLEPQRGLVVDPARKKVFANGENAELTYKEFELLQFLIENEGSTVSRREIIDVIWNGAEGEIPSDRTIDVHVRRLRAKIAGYEDVIRTVRGGGYRFDKHPEVIYEI